MKKPGNNTSYYKLCLSMSPVDRLKKSFELTQRAKKLSRHYNLELKRRMKGFYLLKP
ncbi:MAG: hypothetical protein JXB00_12355 [Bacteroidales bacterium]|nr:hypothetical protein [Bacteroidales bacterium]